jgi:hypothetical protein
MNQENKKLKVFTKQDVIWVKKKKNMKHKKALAERSLTLSLFRSGLLAKHLYTF